MSKPTDLMVEAQWPGNTPKTPRIWTTWKWWNSSMIRVFWCYKIHRICAKKKNTQQESIENWQPPKQQQELLPVVFTCSFPVCSFKVSIFPTFCKSSKWTSPSFKTLLVLSTKKWKNTCPFHPTLPPENRFIVGLGERKKNWLVVSTHLKNMIVKMGSSSPSRDENKKNLLKPPPRKHLPPLDTAQPGRIWFKTRWFRIRT